MVAKEQYNLVSDEEIVKLLVNGGNNSLFSILYERYHDKVLDKCYSLLHSRDLAEEFTEDVLSKTYEKLSGFKGNSSFSSWLYSITYNHCIDFLREKKKLHYPNWNTQNELPEIIDDLEEDLTDIHFSRMMKILDIMHAEERAMLLMKYQDDLPIKDIAKSMRLTEGAAKMRIKRAKARLVYLYKRLYGEYE
jgi:RNA polymerase sigma-70 factor (ECF subfamily)